MREHGGGVSRRDVLRYAGTGAFAGGAMTIALTRPATATPEAMQELIRRTAGGAPVTAGRVRLDIAPLSENGNSVPCTVSVESPMTAADHVRAIHLFNEKNPLPNVISVRLGPRAGRASLSTRIRLSETQEVIALAELSDGSFWFDRAIVIVTLGACLEDSV